MLTVDDYGAIRRARRDGKSIRRIAGEFEHSRNTIRKILKQAEPNPIPSSRDEPGVVRIRIAWRGGLVGERLVGVPVRTIRGTEREGEILDRIRRGVGQGRNDATIAEDLNREGLQPCRGASFTGEVILKIRRRHRILRGLERLRRGERPPGYTLREMAELIGIDPSWISRKISRGPDPDREGRMLRVLPVPEVAIIGGSDEET